MNQINFSDISKHPVSHPASLSPLHPPNQPVQITDLLPFLLLCSTFPPDDRYLDFGMDHTQCRCLKCDSHPPPYFLSLTDQWGEDVCKSSTVTIEQSAFSGSMEVLKILIVCTIKNNIIIILLVFPPVCAKNWYPNDEEQDEVLSVNEIIDAIQC